MQRSAGYQNHTSVRAKQSPTGSAEKQKVAGECASPAHDQSSCRLDSRHVDGLRALVALLDVELDALILLERAVTAAGDRGVVDENILCTAVGGDEAEALSPLNHFTVPCAILFNFSHGEERQFRRPGPTVSRAGSPSGHEPAGSHNFALSVRARPSTTQAVSYRRPLSVSIEAGSPAAVRSTIVPRA